MRCPFCKKDHDKVIDSRSANAGATVRRRRECLACKKRPVSLQTIEDIVNRIEIELYENYDREVKSTKIGDLVMRELKGVDHVAYVRFASVYREFKDVNEFMRELKPMLKGGVRA